MNTIGIQKKTIKPIWKMLTYSKQPSTHVKNPSYVSIPIVKIKNPKIEGVYLIENNKEIKTKGH